MTPRRIKEIPCTKELKYATDKQVAFLVKHCGMTSLSAAQVHRMDAVRMIAAKMDEWRK